MKEYIQKFCPEQLHESVTADVNIILKMPEV